MITVRDQVLSDAGWMAAMSADDDVIRYAEPERIGDHVTEAEIRDEWFPNIFEYQQTGIQWAIEEDGVPVGWVFCRYDDQEGWELGYRLFKPVWGRGIATEAVRAAMAWADANPAVPLVYAMVAAPNVASVRILERAGFVRVSESVWEGMADYRYERPCG